MIAEIEFKTHEGGQSSGLHSSSPPRAPNANIRYEDKGWVLISKARPFMFEENGELRSNTTRRSNSTQRAGALTWMESTRKKPNVS